MGQMFDGATSFNNGSSMNCWNVNGLGGTTPNDFGPSGAATCWSEGDSTDCTSVMDVCGVCGGDGSSCNDDDDDDDEVLTWVLAVVGAVVFLAMALVCVVWCKRKRNKGKQATHASEVEEPRL